MWLFQKAAESDACRQIQKNVLDSSVSDGCLCFKAAFVRQPYFLTGRPEAAPRIILPVCGEAPGQGGLREQPELYQRPCKADGYDCTGADSAAQEESCDYEEEIAENPYPAELDARGDFV